MMILSKHRFLCTAFPKDELHIIFWHLQCILDFIWHWPQLTKLNLFDLEKNWSVFQQTSSTTRSIFCFQLFLVPFRMLRKNGTLTLLLNSQVYTVSSIISHNDSLFCLCWIKYRNINKEPRLFFIWLTKNCVYVCNIWKQYSCWNVFQKW